MYFECSKTDEQMNVKMVFMLFWVYEKQEKNLKKESTLSLIPSDASWYFVSSSYAAIGDSN